ncbi:hypothetical protein [Methanobrevibacter sp.]|uniref:hypothetical protein n=1 Tax=Methanobrevibacter sp. TaxID=66852 RepID=UPI00388F5ABE
MNIKRILLISIVMLAILASFSVVSAGLFDSGKTTVNGIEFNVDGFKDMGTDGLPPIIVSDGSNVETKCFNDDNGQHLTIRVYDNPNKNLSLSNITYQGVSSDSKPINSSHGGKDGIEVKGGHGIVEFAYIQDGKLVVLEGQSYGNLLSYSIGDKKISLDDIIKV